MSAPLVPTSQHRYPMLRFLLTLLLVSQAWGYSVVTQSGHPVSLDPGPFTMKVQLGSASMLSDGSTYNSTVQAAMQIWNAQLGNVQFADQIGSAAAPISNNQINEIGFDSTVYGTDFDANVLAVTVSYYFVTPRADGSYRRSQADIIFNTAYTWDSYRGALRTPEDIRRVALHELGHVLGLDHPDEATAPQSVTALMNSGISNLDTLATDDIAGAQSLYGSLVTPPAITNQPGNRTVYTGQTAQFSASANGKPSPTFRWQRLPAGGGSWADLTDGGSYTGTGTTTLTVAGSSTAMNTDQFRLVATNANGSATSNAATLTVLASAEPSFISHPASQTVTEGNPVTFVASADGVPAPTFQWQKGGVNLAGATNSSYTIVSVVPGDAGSYAVVATNFTGSVTSEAAVLTVKSPPLITSLSPTRQVLTQGQSLSLSTTASGAGTLSYQWMHNGRAVMGATDSNLVIPSTSRNDSGWYFVLVTDVNGTRRSQTIFVTIRPAAATTHIVAWGSNSSGQASVPAGLSDAVAIAAGNNVSVALKANGTVVAWGSSSYGQTNPPAGLNGVLAVAMGSFHALALKDDGTLAPWGTTSYGLASIAASLSDVVAIDAGFYHSLALKSDGTVVAWGDNSYLQTQVPAGLTNVVAVAGKNTSSLALRADGTVVAWGVNSYGQNDVPAGLGNVVAVANGGGHSLALKADGTVVAWGDNSFGQISVPAGLENVAAIATSSASSYAQKVDGTIVSWGLDKEVPAGLNGIISVVGGWQHVIALCAGPVTAPSIGQQPSSHTVTSGSNASFTVTVSGTAPFSYRWQQLAAAGGSWSNVGGANGPELKITPSSWAMNGDQFRCIVSNAAGSVTSSAATLSVVNGQGAPVITAQPDSITAIVGIGTANFSIAAGGSALRYQWQILPAGSSNWSDVFVFEVFTPPSVTAPYVPPDITGINSPTLVIRTDLSRSGQRFRCVVTNVEGRAVSNSALLTVLPNVYFTSQPVSQTVTTGNAVTFTAAATGTPSPAFQWQKNGVNIFGAINSSYTIASTMGEDAGSYQVVVRNSVESATSTAAVLKVTTANGNAVAHGATNFPSIAAAGAVINFSYTVTNTGTKAWGATHYLALQRGDGSLVQMASLSGSAVGGSRTVIFSLPTPATPGTYQYRVQPLENGVEWFGSSVTLSLDVTTPVLSSQGNALAYGTNTFPLSASAGSVVNFSYTVTNAGTKAWGPNHYLALLQSDYSVIQLGGLSGTAAGGARTVTLSLPVPANPGTYQYLVQPLENEVEWFGSPVTLTLIVTPAVVSAQGNALAYGVHSFPLSASAGSVVDFNYNVSNLGTKTWGSNHYLALLDAGFNLIEFADLNGIAPGGGTTARLSFPVPGTPGTYQYIVRPLENGVEWFGTQLSLTLIVTPAVVSAQGNALGYGTTTFPVTVNAGATVNFTYNVKNLGTKAWSSNHYLALLEPGYTLVDFGDLNATAAGGGKAAAVSFTAPVTPGTYHYILRPLENGLEWFGTEVHLTLTVH